MTLAPWIKTLLEKDMKNIIIYADPDEQDEYSVLIEDDGIGEYEDEVELSLTDAESLAEEIQKKNPEYKIIYR